MISRTNCKNIELDLLKRYITLQSIWHLADGGIDPQNLQPSINFMNISQDSKYLFKNWFIMENSEIDDEESEGDNIFIYLFLYNSCMLTFFNSMLTI